MFASDDGTTCDHMTIECIVNDKLASCGLQRRRARRAALCSCLPALLQGETTFRIGPHLREHTDPVEARDRASARCGMRSCCPPSTLHRRAELQTLNRCVLGFYSHRSRSRRPSGISRVCAGFSPHRYRISQVFPCPKSGSPARSLVQTMRQPATPA